MCHFYSHLSFVREFFKEVLIYLHDVVVPQILEEKWQITKGQMFA